MSHAYLIYGNLETGKTVLFAEMERRNLKFDPVDVWIHAVDSGTIDDVRMVRSEAYRKPALSPCRLVILSASTLHEEAQQTLLKSFEEPGDLVIMALIVPNGTPILPTVLSRVQVLNRANGDLSANEGGAVLPFTTKEFLSASSKERLELLKQIFTEENEQEKSQAIALADALENHFLPLAKKDFPNAVQALIDIEHMRKFLFQKGGVAKYILEYLACSLPKV